VLSHYRVLDLTDERGHLAGQVLAALGAEVIAVEPPGGMRARHLGPFVEDRPDPEGSLSHFAYNRGKRSVVLDLTRPDDRAALHRLAAGADVVLESSEPGRMAALGAGHAELAAVNPSLVYTSVTAFGQHGPKAGWAATDLTVMASSCSLVLNGDSDRPPVRLVVPQAFAMGSAVAVCATLVALAERSVSGLGQHVDVSAQEAAMLANQASVLAEAVGSPSLSRTAGGARTGLIDIQLVYPAKDGFVSITHVFGPAIGPRTAALMAWACEEGHCDAELRDKDWVEFNNRVDAGLESVETWERAKAAVTALTTSHTKAELLDEAMRRRLLIAPIAGMDDVLASAQLRHRGFFDTVTHPVAGREVAVPGAFAKFSQRPLPPLGPAPRLGADTEAVLSASPRRPSAPATTGPTPAPARGPLAEVKVLDFTWSIAGPHGVRTLADCGATVVKVESATKPDATRGYRPTHGNEPGHERSALFDTMNAGKLSLQLDLNHPGAREVVLDLVRWADVVIESFSPRAMRAWNLDYEHLREVNPQIVMVSTCLTGQDGPMASFAGYGNLAAAMSGFYGLAGWPDRAPAGPFGAYTDYTSTHLILASTLAALDHRRRTGEGQYVDVAQAEAALHYLGPAVLDYTVNGRVAERAGNRDRELAPHGVYPAAGDDRWVAIACQDDEAWPALCRVLGRDDLACDPALRLAEGRRARADQLDAVVAAWTAGRTAEETEEALQAAGVAVHAVNNSAECLADPHLAARGHFVTVARADGERIVERTRFRLSRTPAAVGVPPLRGQHTDQVLGDLLAYPAERIAALRAEGVLT
jgi:crotonobetainyl-CoA:carnitine CoA-transferase CaiB-like acyl-CoA transferase